MVWMQFHRKKKNRQVPDAFLERFGSTSQEKRRTITGWRAFLCHRRCQGDFVVDTTKSSHYRVFKLLLLHLYAFITLDGSDGISIGIQITQFRSNAFT